MRAQLPGALLAGIASLATLGCAATARFYPVQGPLSTVTPLPALRARFSGFRDTGQISLELPDGTVCQGRWNRIPAHANALGDSSMASAWDAVYGPGYYVARVLGTYLYARSAIAAAAGRVFRVEFYKAVSHDERANRIHGVATDTDGNLYKVVFQIPDEHEP